MVLVAPSILSADFANLEAEIKKVKDAGADWVHVDVMDGAFVPNITIGAPVVKYIRPVTDLFVDVHLMIFKPEKHIPDFIKAGADLVTFHMEAYRHEDFYENVAEREAWEARGKSADDYDIAAIKSTIRLIRDSGAYVGISINPSTPVSALEAILAEVNLVLLMSVNPGFGGQKFMPEVLEKIAALKELAEKQGLKLGSDLKAGEIAVEVDGGVAEGKIADQLKSSGASVLVAGSAVYGSEDIKKTIQNLKS